MNTITITYGPEEYTALLDDLNQIEEVILRRRHQRIGTRLSINHCPWPVRQEIEDIQRHLPLD